MESQLQTLEGEEQERTPFDDAELYDLLFSGLDYGVAFYREQALAAGGPVLDVGCGTGRVLLPLLQVGIDADGLDPSAAMLERARQKTRAAGFHPQLHQVGMQEFRVPRRYALILIAFNTFVHNLTQPDQIATLQICREHLRAEGRLLFDLFYPGLEYLSQPEGVPVLEHEVTYPDTGHRLQIYDTRRLERLQQIQHSEIEIRELNAEGEVVRTCPSRTATRWIYKPEMELLLQLAGYARWEITGFEGERLSGRTEPMVVSAWRA